MSDSRRRRLQKEWKNIQGDRRINEMCSVGAGDSLDFWDAAIMGQPGTPYEGGLFKLSITVPQNYPMEPPKVTFETKIYHPNINEHGSICLDMLQNNWTPAYEIRAVITAICSLLTHPNPDDPLVASIGEEFKSNRPAFEATARLWTMQYAML
ncbi:hypothetical protein DITRI_Ditri03aG0173800 [Diplodiscus trichospermus]